MGNNLTSSTSPTSPTFNNNYYTYLYKKIPPNAIPPSCPEIVRESKKIAKDYYTFYNPTSIQKCIECAKTTLLPPTYTKDVNTTRRLLSTYSAQDPPYSEKTVILSSPLKNSNIILSSTKNSDHTVSYWIQYPILPLHTKLACLKIMNVAITPQNISDVSQKYKTLLWQCESHLKNDIVKCEQIDPLYMDNIIKSLLKKDYKVSSTTSDRQPIKTKQCQISPTLTE